MMNNPDIPQYDYYGTGDIYSPCNPNYPNYQNHPITPCPPKPGLDAYPAPPWDKAIAEHNLDHSSHPYLLSLFKTNTSNYYCKDTIAARDAIGKEIRVEGLMVYVTQTDELYRLEGGIENDNWKLLNVTSKNYARIGRYNPPENPQDGDLYLDLSDERLKFYFLQEWHVIPNQKDITDAIQNHNTDKDAHRARFEEVENIWLTI